jgi:transcriptional regulator with XRE-family HTH domain
MQAASISFGTKLQSLLDGLQPVRTQTWLSEESGVPASTISRLLKGDRNPTPAVIESLAPVLGVEPSFLVQGTDAETRFQESGEWIKKANYEAVVRKLSEYEARMNDMSTELRIAREGIARESAARKDLEGQRSKYHLQLDWARRDLEEAKEQNRQSREDLKRHREGLKGAVAEIASLRAKLKELADELASTSKSGRATAILSGVAAFTGVLTVAHFLTQDAEPEEDRPAKKEASKKPKKS